MKTIAILGAGGFAREAYFHLQHSDYGQFIFVDDASPLQELKLNGTILPVVKDWKFAAYSDCTFIIGVGKPSAKAAMVSKALAAGLKPAPTFIHPRALVQDAEVGHGGIITPGCLVTTNVKIGNYVLVNLNSTVGHDAVVEDFVTINPGCHISGNTIVGTGVLLGTGTAIRESTTIAASATTGAQAAVVSHLTEPLTYVGVPAKPLKKN